MILNFLKTFAIPLVIILVSGLIPTYTDAPDWIWPLGTVVGLGVGAFIFFTQKKDDVDITVDPPVVEDKLCYDEAALVKLTQDFFDRALSASDDFEDKKENAPVALLVAFPTLLSSVVHDGSDKATDLVEYLDGEATRLRERFVPEVKSSDSVG